MTPNKLPPETEDNHNWIDEKDCFLTGFGEGFQAGQKQEREDFCDWLEALQDINPCCDEEDIDNDSVCVRCQTIFDKIKELKSKLAGGKE